MKTQQWSVKALVSYLKLKLDNDSLIQNITVVGELSNFNHHHTNHMYFTLKDEKSRISCVMFASNANQINFTPKNGTKVVIQASVSVFEASGSVQLYVRKMMPLGTGDLAQKFEELKKNLHKEGLFDDKYKKSIPTYPNKIAVVSAKDSAALSDIKTTLNRRWPIANLSVYNTLVQGKLAHLNIIESLKAADNDKHDLIILSRGGGSIEDLWPFNEEELAREIFLLKTPIISGVGHEVDFTIADFVSDKRAPTPTAAAEMSAPDIKDVIFNIKNLNNTLKNNMENIVNNKIMLVDTFFKSANFSHPDIIINPAKTKLDVAKNNINKWKDNQYKMFSDFSKLSSDFKGKTQAMLYQENTKLNNLSNNLNNSISIYRNNIESNFSKQLQLIDSYSPINTLKRGYSIVEKNQNIITDINDININDSITVTMKNGLVSAKVLEKRLNNE